jgi:hypothetical protein
MRTSLLSISCCFLAFSFYGQGFPANSINWPAPNGGKISSGVQHGYNSSYGNAQQSDNTGSQNWSLTDIDGDGRPDLVVTAQLQGGQVTCFSPGNNQYWNVYLNNGSGFANTPLQWALPDGGRINGSVTYGYDHIQGTAFGTHNTGSQSWTLKDFNGDNKPDLVITAQLQGGQVTCFSPGNNQYWKVYLNTGAGFSASAINWELPNGGKISGGTSFGFIHSEGTATSSENTGSQSWGLIDIDGDHKPDLVVTAQLQGGQVTCFSPGSSQYWKVYTNTGNGFNPSALNWSLPAGGRLSGGTTFGFNHVSNIALTADNTGSQSWELLDLDGDNKPELIVTAQLQAGNVSCFSPGNNQYWKVYTNTGSSFSGSAVNWALPAGGHISGGTTLGFTKLSGTAISSDNTGSQSWAMISLDGQSKPSLVVTAQLQGGNVSCFSPGNTPYWKVYANTGNQGFSNNPVHFNLPLGGSLRSGQTYGYNRHADNASALDDTGSQSWLLSDMNGDGSADLVVTAQLQGGYLSTFSPVSNQYWKVFLSDLTTGIQKRDADRTTILTFPNPSRGSFVIRGDREETLILSNELGQAIRHYTLRAEDHFTTEVHGLDRGIYILSGSRTHAKVIVTH